MPTSLTCKELKVLYNESQSLCATLERHLEEHITGTELEIIKINYNRLRITMVALVSSFTSPPYPAKQPVLQILNNIFLPELQKDYIIEFRDQFCIVQNATNGSNSYYKENNYFFDPTTSKKSRAFMKIEQNDLNGYWEVVFFVGSKGVKGIKRGFFNPENDEFIENFSSIKRYGVDLQRADSSGFWRVGTEEKAFLFNPRTKEIVDSFDSVEYHDTNGFWDVKKGGKHYFYNPSTEISVGQEFNFTGISKDKDVDTTWIVRLGWEYYEFDTLTGELTKS